MRCFETAVHRPTGRAPPLTIPLEPPLLVTVPLHRARADDYAPPLPLPLSSATRALTYAPAAWRQARVLSVPPPLPRRGRRGRRLGRALAAGRARAHALQRAGAGDDATHGNQCLAPVMMTSDSLVLSTTSCVMTRALLHLLLPGPPTHARGRQRHERRIAHGARARGAARVAAPDRPNKRDRQEGESTTATVSVVAVEAGRVRVRASASVCTRAYVCACARACVVFLSECASSLRARAHASRHSRTRARASRHSRARARASGIFVCICGTSPSPREELLLLRVRRLTPFICPITRARCTPLSSRKTSVLDYVVTLLVEKGKESVLDFPQSDGLPDLVEVTPWFVISVSRRKDVERVSGSGSRMGHLRMETRGGSERIPWLDLTP